MKVVVALGGNAILGRGEAGTAKEQFARVEGAAKQLVGALGARDKLLVTHGNGPQVGDILLKNELARDVLPPMPLDVCGAESQGMVGYMLQQALEREVRASGAKRQVVTLLTQVLVEGSDPEFRSPTKPVGPFYRRGEADSLRRERGWAMAEDSGRGYRRVVPSPPPREVLEGDTIRRLFEQGVIVIAAGGGGIPVVEKRGRIEGVEAVIDKDRTASLLAASLGAEELTILTDVKGAYLGHGTRRRRLLRRVGVGEMEAHLRSGEFPEGSMGPKVESAVTFVRSGGERAVIAHLDETKAALAGRAGTVISRRSPFSRVGIGPAN